MGGEIGILVKKVEEVDKTSETIPGPFNWPLDSTTLTILFVSLSLPFLFAFWDRQEIIEFPKLQLYFPRFPTRVLSFPNESHPIPNTFQALLSHHRNDSLF